MDTVVYDLAAGLDLLVPGADYSGSLKYSTEQEYGDIVWNDARTKPSYTEAVEASLDVMRKFLAGQIDDKTQLKITTDFTSMLSPGTTISSSCIWQFNSMNLWTNRNNPSLVTYPYDLGVSDNDDGSVNYITLYDAVDVDALYTEMYTHVKTWLDSGRDLKNTLAAKTKQELLDFEDTRE